MPEILKNILKNAVKINGADVERHLKENKLALDAPIILLCENGKSSGVVCGILEKQGYKNVYVAEGGIEGLLSEV